MASPQPLTVIVLGATGVTGRQAVPYLRERSRELGFSWGIAGRSAERLEALVADWPAAERPEIVVVDTEAPETVAAAIGRTEAVVNFAGPFARMAPGVIEAAVGAGIAYLDVTGEIDFAAEIVARWHHRASQTGARIVQVGGFEALPFDLLVAATIERLESRHEGEAAESIDVVLAGSPPPGRPHASDLVSNGTFESLREAMAGDGAHLLGDPAALIGDLAAADLVREVSPISNRPRWKPGVGPLAPMLPSPAINPPVIQRSLALAGRPPIRYREAVAVAAMVPTVPLQALVAGSASALNGGLSLLAKAPAAVRRPVTGAMKILSPGGGPREDRLEGWRWSIECEVRGSGGAVVGGRLEAEGHPGYLATSRMTAEAGLILALPDADSPEIAGVLTPAGALGTAELGRFAAAGVRFA
jgi:short subunit dehydrogenase-like uncharacterized protein